VRRENRNRPHQTSRDFGGLCFLVESSLVYDEEMQWTIARNDAVRFSLMVAHGAFLLAPRAEIVYA
jgi:hypothetical protein